MAETRTCERCGLTAWADSGRVRTHTIENHDASEIVDKTLCADCFDDLDDPVEIRRSRDLIKDVMGGI